jgi:hypothetical protein
MFFPNLTFLGVEASRASKLSVTRIAPLTFETRLPSSILQETKPPVLTGSSGPAVLNLQLRAARSDAVYVWMIRGVMKKINSWLEVLTTVCLNRLPRIGRLPSTGTCVMLIEFCV